MGNNKVRKLAAKKRLFAGKSDHKHIYNVPVNLEISAINDQGQICNITYYLATRCIKCNALVVEGFIQKPMVGLGLVRAKSSHKHRIDLKDITLI